MPLAAGVTVRSERRNNGLLGRAAVLEFAVEAAAAAAAPALAVGSKPRRPAAPPSSLSRARCTDPAACGGGFGSATPLLRLDRPISADASAGVMPCVVDTAAAADAARSSGGNAALASERASRTEARDMLRAISGVDCCTGDCFSVPLCDAARGNAAAGTEGPRFISEAADGGGGGDIKP